MKQTCRWMTHEGLELVFDATADEAALFERAKAMFAEKAGMDAIARLYLSPDSVLYKGRAGPEVVQMGLYKAIKDMAKRRGLEDGLLSDRPGSRPELDEFEVSRAKN